MMKKVMNAPQAYVDEMLSGLCGAHPEYYRQFGLQNRVIGRPNAPIEGKVGIVTGGGSGHLPVFTGYVGEGLLDACAIGNVFASPTVDQIAEAIRVANGGKGVLLLYGNYGGDVMNFEMAAEMLELEDILTQTVVVADDVASAPPEDSQKRRGVAGMVLGFKTAGAKAAQGARLAEVAAVAQKTLDATRTMGVALTPCTVPEAGNPTFEIGDDEMEIGMGIHGEPGVRRGPLTTAADITREILEGILGDQPLANGDKVCAMINSLGATPPEELYIVYGHVASKLKDLGVEIAVPLVGRYATSMEMAGLSISICKLDDEIQSLLEASCDCAFWKV
jgi:dihydroxyacetone kinase-like protein